VCVFVGADIDECASDEVCMYGTCVNKPGGYECRCDDQHQLTPAGTGCVGPSNSLTVTSLYSSVTYLLSGGISKTFAFR